MARSYAHEYLPYLYNALDEEIGILVRVATPHDRKKLTAILYEARKESGDPALAELMLLQVKEDTIFIAKRSTELEE